MITVTVPPATAPVEVSFEQQHQESSYEKRCRENGLDPKKVEAFFSAVAAGTYKEFFKDSKGRLKYGYLYVQGLSLYLGSICYLVKAHARGKIHIRHAVKQCRYVPVPDSDKYRRVEKKYRVNVVSHAEQRKIFAELFDRLSV
jgi:hypothetical protein